MFLIVSYVCTTTTNNNTHTVYRFLRRLGRAKKAELGRWDVEADGAPQGTTEEDIVQLMLLGRTRPLPYFVDLPPAKLENRKMFVTTFNCGECTLSMIADTIGDWIPKDVDVYVSAWLAVLGASVL